MKFTKTHEWIKQEKSTDTIVTIGISDHAQGELSDIVYVQFPEVNAEFKKGDVMLSIESVKAASDVYAPLSGKVIAVNDALESAPEKINQSPEQDGWLVQLEISNPEELEKLIDETTYKHSLTED